jgi:7,8-dihydropterin-6-yl-methyl-4-(beta-D-ribofuranosyl)aminobenzene 5'-phosphate synthase
MRGSITVLIDNTATRPGLRSEHGLSMFIEVDGHALLFDTGQSGLILHNAKLLGVDLSKIEAIVLSHGHYDHTGGLVAVLKSIPHRPPIYAHPDFFVDRYSFSTGTAREIGIADDSEKSLDGAALRLSIEPQEIFPGVVSTGEIPRVTDYEDVGGKFSLDLDRKRPDCIPDDQSIIVDAPDGLIVCCGCCHSGLVNTLLRVGELFPGRGFDMVIGGLHMRGVSKNRLENTIDKLRELGVRKILGGHCTGKREAEILAEALPEILPPMEVGTRIEFGR